MSKIWYCYNCGYEVTARGRCHQCKEKFLASPLPELAPGDDDDEVGYRLEDWEDAVRGRLLHALVRNEILHRLEADELVVAVADEERVDELVAVAAEDPADRAAGRYGGDRGGGTAPGGHSEGSGSLDTTYLGHTHINGGVADPNLLDVRSAGGNAAAADGDPGGTLHLEPLTLDEMRTVATQIGRLHDAAGRLQADPTDMEADSDVAEASSAVFVTDQLVGLNEDTWAAVGRTTRRLLGALGSEEAQEEEISRQAGILTVLLDDIAETVAREADADGDTGGAHEAEASHADAHGDEEDGEAADNEAEDGEAEDGEAAGGSFGEEETVYELPDWLPEQRAELTMVLAKVGISAVWDQGDLVIPAEREADVEALFDGIHGVADSEESDAAQYHEIEELFAATSRLVGDPADPAKAADFLRTVPAVEGSTPLGFDGIRWSAIRKRGRVLADLIEHKGSTEVVASEAAALRDLLRALV